MSAKVLEQRGSLPGALDEASMEDLVREMLKRIGEDPEREGLTGTPERVARSMAFLTKGYEQTCAGAIGKGIFEEHHRNMVLVKDIEMYSMCEHHMLPFFGRVHRRVYPGWKNCRAQQDGSYCRGLCPAPSGPRTFDGANCRGPMDTPAATWRGRGHRGLSSLHDDARCTKQGSKTITSAMRGTFLTDSSTREEFLRLSTSHHGPIGQ